MGSGQCHQNADGLSRQEWSDGKENKQDDNMEPLDELDDNTNLEERGHSDGGGGVKGQPLPSLLGREARSESN